MADDILNQCTSVSVYFYCDLLGLSWLTEFFFLLGLCEELLPCLDIFFLLSAYVIYIYLGFLAYILLIWRCLCLLLIVDASYLAV